jgi:hypothetical protein
LFVIFLCVVSNMQNTIYTALTGSKKAQFSSAVGLLLVVTIGVFVLSYSAYLRGRSRVSDPTFINTELTATLRLWPAPPPPGGYLAPESHSALMAVERALLVRARHGPADLRCLHAASLFDPAPNVMAVRWSSTEWTIVHKPRVRIAKDAPVRPVRHVSVRDVTAFHVWMMAAEVVLESDDDDPAGGAVVRDEPLAHCLQTIKGIVSVVY